MQVVLKIKPPLINLKSEAERGSALVECGICIALVAIVCVTAASGMGRTISGLFQGANLQIQGGGFAGTEPPPGGGIPGGGEGEG